MIIDCHTHLDEEGGADKLLRSMDEAGIDASMVIAETLPGDISNAAQVLDAVRRSERLWAIINCVFSRTLELNYVEELTRLLHDDRAVGFKFYLGYEEYSPNDQRLYRSYSRICLIRRSAGRFSTNPSNRASRRRFASGFSGRSSPSLAE